MKSNIVSEERGNSHTVIFRKPTGMSPFQPIKGHIPVTTQKHGTISDTKMHKDDDTMSRDAIHAAMEKSGEKIIRIIFIVRNDFSTFDAN